MFPFNTISSGIGAVVSGVKRGIDWGIEKTKKLMVKPMKIIENVRDSIVGLFEGPKKDLDISIKKAGEGFDKDVAHGIVKPLRELVATNEVDKAEGRLFAEQGLEATQKLDAMMKHLDRTPDEIAELAATADAVEKHWGSAVEAEEAIIAPDPLPGDEFFAPQIAGFINDLRGREGAGAAATPLKINKKLDEKARHRAINFSQRDLSKLPPYRLIRVHPTKRNDVEKEGKGLTMEGEFPRFPLSGDERERATKPEVVGDDGYKATIPERDEDYVKRYLDDEHKRDAIQTAELKFTLDLHDDNYPLDGDPRRLFYEVLSKQDKDKQALLLNMSQIGIGIERKGHKVYLCILMSDETPYGEDIVSAPDIGRPENYSSNDRWIARIPEEKRNWKQDEDNEDEYSIQELYDGNAKKGIPEFRAGNTLLHYSRFRDRILELKEEGKNVDILPPDVHPGEPVGDKTYDTLHINLMVNGEERRLRLIKGTDIVEFPRLIGDVEDKKSGTGDFLTLGEYLEKVEKSLDRKLISFPSKAPKQKKRQAPPAAMAD